MRILALSHMYPSTFNDLAGIFVHQQMKALSDEGGEVIVMSPKPSTPLLITLLKRKWRRISQVPACAEIDGIEVQYPRYVAFPRAMFFAGSGMRMYKGIRQSVHAIYREWPFDLIHAHVALPDGYAAAMLAKEIGVPLVVTIHGQDVQYTVHRSVACRKALAYALEQAAQVIVVSWKLRHLVDQFFDLGERTIVIPNGVDPEAVCDAVAAGEAGPVLLSVSNLLPTKGIALNIEAVAALKDSHPNLNYRVVGGGREEKSLRELVSKRGIANKVSFLGRQPHARVMQEMANCTVFSLPSWQEGFGVVYLEAMASGKPVIGCQGEGIEDFVEHGETGFLVEPRDVPSLVDTIGFLFEHATEARNIGRKGRAHVLNNLTWQKSAQRVIAVYERVLDGR